MGLILTSVKGRKACARTKVVGASGEKVEVAIEAMEKNSISDRNCVINIISY